MSPLTRRGLITAAAAAAAAAAPQLAGPKNIVVSSANGLAASRKVMDVLQKRGRYT